MTTNELIDKLMKTDPSGKLQVCIRWREHSELAPCNEVVKTELISFRRTEIIALGI